MDRFPAFSQNINYAEYPPQFNPANLQNLHKYDGKQDPCQWLRIYSTAIEVEGGDKLYKGNLLLDGPRIGTTDVAREPEARHDPLLGGHEEAHR